MRCSNRIRAKRRVAALAGLSVLAVAVPAAPQGTPPLPTDVPVLLVGSVQLDGSRLAPYEDVRFAMGSAAKTGPLELGQQVETRAFTVQSLRRETRGGADVWVRSFMIQREADGPPLARGEIVLDGRTLAPISSRVEQGGNTTDFEYDWSAYEVRQGGPDVARAEWSSEPMDIQSLEAAAHETWMAALPLKQGYRAMIPAILAGGGGKWWAVPHVVSSEAIDIGDGVSRDAWVVELDWWGMGASHLSHTPGGGANGSGGAGGKYWVLKNPVSGVPGVVRIRTEADAENDSVIQLQASTTSG